MLNKIIRYFLENKLITLILLAREKADIVQAAAPKAAPLKHEEQLFVLICKILYIKSVNHTFAAVAHKRRRPNITFRIFLTAPV